MKNIIKKRSKTNVSKKIISGCKSRKVSVKNFITVIFFKLKKKEKLRFKKERFVHFNSQKQIEGLYRAVME
jgi:hypothetical protein